MRLLVRCKRDSNALAGTLRWILYSQGCKSPIAIVRRPCYHPPGYHDKDKDKGKIPTSTTDEPPDSCPNDLGSTATITLPRTLARSLIKADPSEDWESTLGEFLGTREKRPSGRDSTAADDGDGAAAAKAEGSTDRGAVCGALGQVEEEPTHTLPPNWSNLVSSLCLRTNFEPAELADFYQRFRQLAGKKEYLTAEEFRRTVRRNFGIMKEEWVKKYFQAFDRDQNGTIEFKEYVMGFAGMARVLTDKKANSLIGLSTGSNIVRSGRNARLFWDRPPTRIAVIKKWKNSIVASKTVRLVEWIHSQEGLTVLLDPSEDELLDEEGKPQGRTFMPDVERFNPENLAKEADFIICLGGDGTVLKAGQYFDDSAPIPPTLAFSMGSLGFLAPFTPEQCRPMIMRVLEAYRKPVSVTLRTRLKGEVYDRDGQLERIFFSLNEFIVNRGISGVLSTLEVYVDGELVTTAQGDGLIVASPSGSTAYNISAGGCMVSPLVPATLITPIAPHSLSFRPILTSASSEITVRIPDTARADGWMCHDATEAVVMKKGYYVKLSTASIPMPTVNHRELDGDWFQSIRDKLNWNLRTEQAPWEGDLPKQEALPPSRIKALLGRPRSSTFNGPIAQEETAKRAPNSGQAASPI